jgi:hypothetical protein
MIIFLFFMGSFSINGVFAQNENPPDTVIRAVLKQAALKYNIPSVILMGIAYNESGWRQFDSSGNPVIHYNSSSSFDIGIMQINSVGRSDINKLETDIYYNIDIGAKILDGKWKITPGIGDRDRNVLENWYYAIWAYNGFSYTNNPNNPEGRHYQDRVIANVAKQVLGSDGQPLWTPVQISKPDPSEILNPPDWIPTPTPFHYGDLYSNIYEGDNARLLAGPDNSVIPVGSGFSISFEMQNVGTTTWKNVASSQNGGYHATLKIGKGSNLKEIEKSISSSVEPGENTIFTFTTSVAEEGEYNLTFEMYDGINPFGPSIQAGLYAYDVTINDLSAILNNPFKVGDIVPIKFGLNTEDSIALSPFAQINLLNTTGNVIYSSFVTPDITMNGTVEDIVTHFIAGTGATVNGNYILDVRLFLKRERSQGFPVEGNLCLSPCYAEYKKDLVIGDQRNGLFLNSNPQGADILINGSDSGLFTPSFVPLSSGNYSVTLSRVGFNDDNFQCTIGTGVSSLSEELIAIPAQVNLNLSSQSLNFGEIYTGVSDYRNVRLQFSGSLGEIGVVGTSAKWISIYPLSFDSSTTFTISIDSRWLQEGQTLNGTVTFDTGTVKTALSVAVKTLYSSVIFSLDPDDATMREGDNLFIDAYVKTPLKIIDNVNFTLSYDPAFLSVDSVSPDVSNFAVGNISQNSGFISFDGTNISGTTGQFKILTVEFTALKNTSGAKTLVDFSDAHAFSGGVEEDNLPFDSEIQVLEKLRLPGAIQNLKTQDLIGKIKLTWNPGEAGSYPVKEYDIFRSKTDSITDSIFIGSVNSNVYSFTDTGPFERIPYYYWVIATDRMNNSSSYAMPVKIQPTVFSNTLPSSVTLEFYIGKPYVYINGIMIKMEVAPFIEGGRTFVPVRYIAEPFGAQVIWNGNEKKVTLIHKKFIELWIGNPQAMVDDAPTLIDPSNTQIVPFIVDGRTLLPLRFVAETFGADVSWDPTTKKVTIEYKN